MVLQALRLGENTNRVSLERRWGPKTEPGTCQSNPEMVSTNTAHITRGSTNFCISGSLLSILFLASFFYVLFCFSVFYSHRAHSIMLHGVRSFLRFGVPEPLHCVNFSPRLRGGKAHHFTFSEKDFFRPVLTKTE